MISRFRSKIVTVESKKIQEHYHKNRFSKDQGNVSSNLYFASKIFRYLPINFTDGYEFACNYSINNTVTLECKCYPLKHIHCYSKLNASCGKLKAEDNLNSWPNKKTEDSGAYKYQITHKDATEIVRQWRHSTNGTTNYMSMTLQQIVTPECQCTLFVLFPTFRHIKINIPATEKKTHFLLTIVQGYKLS